MRQAGRLEMGVLGPVPVHDVSAALGRCLDRVGVDVDHDERAAGVLELRRDAAADAAEAADDRVVAQLADRLSPPSLSEVLPHDPARDQLDDRARKVEEELPRLP